MKHSYTIGCTCSRCTRELERRTQQSGIDAARNTSRISGRTERRTHNTPKSRRPVVGSQEWAETRGDDIDSESGDY